MGNVFKFEDYEEIFVNSEAAAVAAFARVISFGSSAAAVEPVPELNSEEDHDNGDDKKAKKKKKRRRRKRKEEVLISSTVKDEDKLVAPTKNGSITYCKKNDGKGWQCKRPANLQHSLCDHHLDLLRNYSSRTNNRESYESETDQQQPVIKNQRPKAAAAAAAATAESAGDGFYYYAGFGPWRGKKRSNGTTADHGRPKEAASGDQDDNDDDDDDEKEEERKDESGDGGSDAPVAGDDLDDDTNDEDDDVENKGRYKKKGRKRVKARSLKSLM